jgi:hypothetical protein
MDSTNLERLFARIIFEYVTKDNEQGRTIMYAYNRQVLESLKIEPFKDKAQYIEVGQIIELEGFKCKVVEINFRLEHELFEMTNTAGLNVYSPTEPTDYNLQIGVFVQRVDE